MRIRSFLFLIVLSIFLIIQLAGIHYLTEIDTDHDLEFNYTYTWHLNGLDGWYDDYDEDFEAAGHYVVDYDGDTADVVGKVSWYWENSTDGYRDTSEEDDETYKFTYSLKSGKYLKGTDQDEFNASGMNVWFHLPQGMGKEEYDILDDEYDKKPKDVIWIGAHMPFMGYRLHASGEFSRKDVYGNMTAEYESNYYFTSEGYLLGELYEETDEGYSDGGSYGRQWGKFEIESTVFVTSASYDREFGWYYYFWAYWSPVLIIAFCLFVVYDLIRWRPKTIKHRKVTIERKVPVNKTIDIQSSYNNCIQSYLIRGRMKEGMIINAHSEEEVKGIGVVEPEKDIGSFYGAYSKEMIKYTNVKFAFVEDKDVPGYTVIDKYDIFQVMDLENSEFSYDSELIKPVTKKYYKGIMKTLAKEDYGTRWMKRVKWVLKAAKRDIIFVAVISEHEKWVRDIVEKHKHKIKKMREPQKVEGEVIMGFGFATPCERSGWLYSLYVHPAFRNKGLGAGLVNARLAALKNIGCKTAILEIAEWNGPARSIYESFKTKKMGQMTLVGKKIPKVKVRRH